MAIGSTYKFGKGIPTWHGVPMISMDNWVGFWGSKVWFVDGDSGLDGNTRDSSPTRALATVSQAISLASAYDTIYVKPRVPTSDASDPEVYAEELIIPYAKHSLNIIGCRSGHDNYYGPKLKLGTADAVVDVYAPALTLENFTVHRRSSNTKGIYLRGITGYATMGGSIGTHISNCMIRYASTQGIYVEAGYHSNINNCTFWGGSLDIYLVGSAVPQRGMQVRSCEFFPANGVVQANPHIRLLGESTEVLIDDCKFDAVPSGNIYIQATGNVDGLISNCRFAFGTGTLNAAAASGEIQLGSGTLSISNLTGSNSALVDQA
jgi:hypothetical protein